MPFPKNCRYCCDSGWGGWVQSVVAWDNISVDNTDPLNPIVSWEDKVFQTEWVDNGDQNLLNLIAWDWISLNNSGWDTTITNDLLWMENSLLVTDAWNDLTWVRGRWELPFATIQAAHDAANTWDVIYVMPWDHNNWLTGLLVITKSLTIVANWVNMPYIELAWANNRVTITCYSIWAPTWVGFSWYRGILKTGTGHYTLRGDSMFFGIDPRIPVNTAYELWLIQNTSNGWSLTVEITRVQTNWVTRWSNWSLQNPQSRWPFIKDVWTNPNFILTFKWCIFTQVTSWLPADAYKYFVTSKVIYKSCQFALVDTISSHDAQFGQSTWDVFYESCAIWGSLRYNLASWNAFFKNTHVTWELFMFSNPIVSLWWNSADIITGAISWDPFLITVTLPEPPVFNFSNI